MPVLQEQKTGLSHALIANQAESQKLARTYSQVPKVSATEGASIATHSGANGIQDSGVPPNCSSSPITPLG